MKISLAARGPVAVALLALSLGAAGCAYRLGSTLPPGLSSVHVPTVVNRTDEPQVERDVTRSLVQEFQRDGTLRIAEAGAADSRIDVTVSGFKLLPLRYERDAAKTAREYRLLLEADFVLRRTRDDTVLMQRRVQGEATFTFAGDMATSKRSALPEATRDLAHDIVEAVVEFW